MTRYLATAGPPDFGKCRYCGQGLEVHDTLLGCPEKKSMFKAKSAELWNVCANCGLDLKAHDCNACPKTEKVLGKTFARKHRYEPCSGTDFCQYCGLDQASWIHQPESTEGYAIVHPTEDRFPEQCGEFRRIIEQMYRVHLEKNYDYSPMNILATGMVGVVTRIWDKVARVMNLTGFDIQRGSFGVPKEAKNESVDDTLLDLANYAVIALILKRRKWGK